MTTMELWLQGGGSQVNLCGDSLSGKFREKASILHKIAKKKCQVDDSEKANGVASRSGKKSLTLASTELKRSTSLTQHVLRVNKCFCQVMDVPEHNVGHNEQTYFFYFYTPKGFA